MKIERAPLFILACIGLSAFFAASEARGQDKTKPKAEADSTMKLHGGEEGTIFKSLRIEGEDRVRIEFERPSLDLGLDPKTAPGLDWEGFRTALDRKALDALTPFFSLSAVTRPQLFARPWLGRFTTGNVALFRPAVEGVERWRLTVADSRGETVAKFDGTGKPPKQIAWNGRSLRGEPVPPGLTYSHVLEAYDRAGNKRNFVGEGFEIPPYVAQTPDALVMLFAGSELISAAPAGRDFAPPILLEAANWINESGKPGQTVRVEVTARSFEDAKNKADSIIGYLEPLVLGDPHRLQAVTHVEPDAPDTGTIAIAVTSKTK
jgi:hypothetical protein